jgi:hypothetical protein
MQGMKTRVGLAILCAVIGGFGVLKLALPGGAEPGVPRAGADENPVQIDSSNLIQVLSNYKSWKVVNPERYFVPNPTAALCAAPTQAEVSPHRGKYILVYTNPRAERPLTQMKTPVFPRGAVVVKEKYASAEAETPELLTVMVKQAKGYNPAAGDWAYFVVSAPELKIIAGGKLKNCASCHTISKASGYVFRSYLPAETDAKLRSGLFKSMS